LAELTIPEVPTAGLVDVFWLILLGAAVPPDSGSELATVVEVADPVVSSPATRPSFVVFSLTLLLEELFRVAD
jgi:hypothetical protein